MDKHIMYNYPVKCPDCGKEFQTMIERVFHMKKKHGTCFD